MATFYFNAAVDNDWQTLGNWWMAYDAEADTHSVPATALPTSTDDVEVRSGIYSNSGSDPTVANAVFWSGGLLWIDRAITITGLCTFNGAAENYGAITGNCAFYSYSATGGSIIGNCTFNDTSVTYDGALITGDCTFNDSSYNTGAITGNCTFNDSSYNSDLYGYGTSGIITGDCTFNDSSYNAGTITGNCTFNGATNGSGYVWGAVAGDCTFNDGANEIWAYVDGNCIFNGSSENGGVVSGNCTFNDSAKLYRLSYDGEAAVGRVGGNCAISVAGAALSLDGWGHYIRNFYNGNDRIEGTIEIIYDKGINGSSILGVV